MIPLTRHGAIKFNRPCAAEEAQTSVKGMEDNAIHAKYIELVSNQSMTEHYA